MIKSETIFKVKKYKDIRELLKDATEKFSQNKAFILKEKKDGTLNYRNITFKHLYDDVNSLGSALLKKGFKDKRIAIIRKKQL